jgi:hypothetical protein
MRAGFNWEMLKARGPVRSPRCKWTHLSVHVCDSVRSSPAAALGNSKIGNQELSCRESRRLAVLDDEALSTGDETGVLGSGRRHRGETTFLVRALRLR